MKTAIKLVFILILVSFISGFGIREWHEQKLGELIIGLSVLASSFILMPLFLVHRWKGKKLEDYTLTKERMDQMRDKK